MATLDGSDPVFAARVQQMIAASGGRLYLKSGYRSPELQMQLWQQAVQKYGSEEAARKWVAKPEALGGKGSNHTHGLAADIGGDMGVLHELAPKFGLWFPMEWEPWHVEIVGSREHANRDAYTPSPHGDPNPIDKDVSQDPSYWAGVLSDAILQDLIPGADTQDFTSVDKTKTATPGSQHATGGAPQTTTVATDGSAEDKFLGFVRQHESGGNYNETSHIGKASGAYQVMHSTWGGYGGYDAAGLAPANVQDEFARQHLQNIIKETGSNDPGVWAAAWYLGTGGAKEWMANGMGSYVPPENSLDVLDYYNQARSAVGV